MTDHRHSEQVDAPAQQLFDYLADVRHLPEYFSSMTSATPAEGEAVHVVAKVEDVTRSSEAWFRVDHEERALSWGSTGESPYHGELRVTGDDERSEVALRLHTERGGDDAVADGIRTTLASIKSLVESGPAPGPTT